MTRVYPPHPLRIAAGCLGTGALAALAFPLLLPELGNEPMLEVLPREAFIIVAGAYLHALAVSTLSTRQVATRGWLAGVGFFAVLIFWIDVAMVRYGGMAQWQAVPVMALLIGWCALFWSAAPLLARVVGERTRLPMPLALGVSVVGLEWLRSVLVGGFPWGALGYSQARNLPLAQLASLGGVSLVSFVVAALGALVAHAWLTHSRRAALLAGAALLLAHLPGVVRLMQAPSGRGEPVEVALLQASVPQTIKSKSREHRELILARYEELTRRAVARGADVVIWPEAAWPTRLAPDASSLPGYVPGVELLVGAATITFEPTARATNSAFAVTRIGAITGRYDKVHLVPFGEYVPLGWLLPVEKIVPGFMDFSPGTRLAPLGSAAWGVLVCYDGIFDDTARGHVKAGARALANLTNDAWYGASSAPFQHRDFYVLRAIETDRWVARATNSGVSLFVDPFGRRYDETALDETTLAQRRIELRDTLTPYVRIGNWVVWLSLAVLVVALALEAYAAREAMVFWNRGAGP